MSKKNLVVFISGNGSNLKAIIDACNNNKINAKVNLVVSNNPSANGLGYARANQIEHVAIDHRIYKTRREYEIEIDKIIQTYDVDLICLAGFMRILSPEFISEYENKIINIHPSLLPSFKGINAIEQAFNFGSKVTGCTVHIVTSDIDSGKILIQKPVMIEEDDTLIDITEKVHQQEHLAYIEAINKFFQQ